MLCAMCPVALLYSEDMCRSGLSCLLCGVSILLHCCVSTCRSGLSCLLCGVSILLQCCVNMCRSGLMSTVWSEYPVAL